MDKNIVARSLKRAQALINDGQFNQLVEAKSKGVSDDTQYKPSAPRQIKGDPLAYSQNITEESAAAKLPKSIRESMLNNPIDVSKLGSGASVLDGIEGMEDLEYEERTTPAIMPQRRINESQVQASPTTVAIPATIDYEYIKYIVNESIKANIQEIGKQLIAENTMVGLKVKPNGTIAFVDTKGNVYEGKLTLKKKGDK